MNFCSDCGTALTSSAKFCSECGASTSLDVVDAVETRSYKVFTKAYIAFLACVAVVALAVIGVLFHGRSADASADTTQISETSTTTSTAVDSQQAKTCLEWRTNYKSQYVTGGMQQGYDQFGQSVVTSAPGHFEQVPSGQTCVRWG